MITLMLPLLAFLFAPTALLSVAEKRDLLPEGLFKMEYLMSSVRGRGRGRASASPPERPHQSPSSFGTGCTVHDAGPTDPTH